MTFLFTDIEGSTQLARRLGPGYPERLAAHHRILRESIAGHRGMVVSTEGDAFFAVFPFARDAVGAVVNAQRSLVAEGAGLDDPIRVRMGMNTGEALLGGDNYTGLDLVRAARIMAAAHGGQVLVSDGTRGILAGDLPDGAHLRFIGTYRLKDLAEPERLHQLEAAGLQPAFPPLRALDVRQAHLPPEATSFIGRAEEMGTVAALLLDHRLVTLTGPGGSGKTRLALRCAADVAGRAADGTFFVGLAAIAAGVEVSRAVASAIGLPERQDLAPADIVRDWLREREVLLVLDNLEQVEGAAAAVSALLATAPRLRVLATSRGPLRVAGEQEFVVPPFEVPAAGADPGAIEASDAVRLFLDRARLVRATFAPTPADLGVIADIARRLDGLPLAIELAAARIRLLPVSAIHDRLGHRLDVLVHGPLTVPQRQQSLRETIAWSHDLLDEQDRVVFRRMATFVGGWTYEAAEVIAGGPPVGDVGQALERLADQSLVQASPGGEEPRFAMLATIGEFALEQLVASGDEAEATRRHVGFFRAFAERAQAASEGTDAAVWFDRIELDLDNFRAAMDRAEAQGDSASAMAIAAALGTFWLRRNHSAEGQRRLVGLVELAATDDGPEVAAAALQAALIATWLGDYTTGRRMGGEAADRFRRVGDRQGLAIAMSTVGFSTIEIDPATALGLLEQSPAGVDAHQEGQIYLGLATAQFALGRVADARASLERSLERLQDSGDWVFVLNAGVFLARIQLIMGEVQDGIAGYRRTLEMSRALDFRLGVAIALEYLAEVSVWAGDVERAVRLGAVAERIKGELGGGIPPGIGGGLDPLAVGRAELSPDAFERETAAGRMLAIDSAVAEALSIEPPYVIPPAYLTAPVTGRAGDQGQGARR